MKKITLDIAMAIGIVLTMLFSGFSSFAQDCESIRGEVLRLHIPANSDSEYDQQIKLRLRDFVLQQYGTQLSCEGDLAGAIQHTRELLPEIEQACNGFLAAEGAPYRAKAELCEMYFTTRTYADITLPAGTYTALRITLGSGEGQNWWCVMFPPLCIPAASAPETDIFPDALKNKGNVSIKFALFEFFEWLLG